MAGQLKSAVPSQRKFFFLISALAALLAGCLLVILKAFVEHAALRNALGTVCLIILSPLLWIAIEAIVSAALDTGLGKIEIHLPKWVHQAAIAFLVIGSLMLLADDVFEFGWFW